MLPSPDIRLGLRLAIRARFLTVSFWLLMALAAIVLLAAQFSGRQPATVALDVGLSAIRLALPLMIVFLAQELINREFDRRYFLTSLTYPRPRHQLLIGRLVATLVLITALLSVMGGLLAGLVILIGEGYDQATDVALGIPYLITLAFIAIDLLVVTAMGLLLATIATTPSFILIGTLGFMVVARAYSGIIALLDREYALVPGQELYQESIGLLGYLLPDLGSLDVRMIALYGTMEFLPEEWPLLLFSAVAYATALVVFALWVLQKKRFS